MMRRTILMTAGLLAMSACGNPGEQDQRAGAGAENNAPASTLAAPNAQAFVQAQAMSDMYEIAAGKIALSRADNARTKGFAQMMITDHTRASAMLKEAIAASGQSFALPERLDNEHQAKIDILQSLNGADFEREYLGQQMAAHGKALTMLQIYGDNGDLAELRQFAQGAIPVVRRHHDWLEQNSPRPSSDTGTPGASMSATPAP